MALNTRTLTANFGVSAGMPSALNLSVIFTESAVNAAAGTSTVTAVVKVKNNSSAKELWYRYLTGAIKIRVGSYTKTLTRGQVTFDLKPGRTTTHATLYFTGIKHGAGTVSVAMSQTLPSTGGAGAASATNSLTLNNAPAPPTPPIWPSNGNAVGPTGVGTGTYVNWTNMINKSATGGTIVAPYTGLRLLVAQAAFPNHFNPFTRATDLSNVAGGKLALSNYVVQSFWHTTLGKTLPSLPVYYSNVPANRLLKVVPPINPPATATGWGVAVARKVGSAADVNLARVQSLAGSTKIPLSKFWLSPTAGPATTGEKVPTSSFANNFVWSSNTVIELSNSPYPTTNTVATLGGFWYQFTLVARNKASAGTYSRPQIYYVPGEAPSLGQNTNGDAGEGTDNVVYAPMANVAVIARGLNRVNASASVVPVVAQVIDFAAASATLTPGTDAEVINYCSDPRAYWLTANSTGNNTASPYVKEVALAGYTSKNAQPLPTQMLYALRELGLDELDRGHVQTFVAANNNTGSTVQAYVHIGGNPDAGNTAASQAVPVGATSVQVSALAWINSATTTPRTVTPYAGVKFCALYANGVVISTNVAPLSAIPINSLAQLCATYTLPALTSRVSAAFVANTAAGAGWNGGYAAAESINMTGFMLLFNQRSDTPYFDGGYPSLPPSVFQLRTGGDLAFTTLTSVPNILSGSAGVP